MIYRQTRRMFLKTAAAATVATVTASAQSRPPEGFRALFDGKTFNGWRQIPRVPVPAYPGAREPSVDSPAYKRALTSRGKWSIDNGVITGGQDPPGSGLGGYLITEEVFGNFELLIDVNPDWSSDSGIMVRAAKNGGQGFQVHLDYRIQGSVATFYGNGLGAFRARHYAFMPKLDANGKAIGLERIEPPAAGEKERLAWASDPNEFFRVWRFGDWNTLRVRVTGGKYPRLATWVNGAHIAELDAATLKANNYDRDAVANLLGPQGHIALEVHDSDPNSPDPIQRVRWLPGNVCRWRNIFIKTL